MIDIVSIALVTIAIGLLLLILPIVATVLAVKAKRRVREMQMRLDEIQYRIEELGRETGDRPLVRAVEKPVAEKVVAEPIKPVIEPEPPPADHAAEEPEPRPAAAKASSIEERIGLTWFTRIGVILVIVGLGFFFKFMVDNDWIGPWGRISIGVVAGIFFLVWGELLSRKKKTHFVFVQGMVGLGLALLLVTAYASFGFYHLVPVLPAFAVVALLAILGGALSVHHRAESILVLSLVAVFLNPVLLSTGVDRPFALFTYLLLMTSGTLWVAIRQNFRVATWTAIAGITALFSGWYVRFFDVSPPPPIGLYDRPPEELHGAYFPVTARWVPLIYAFLFPLQWTLAGLWIRIRGKRVTAVALYLAAAVSGHAAFAALLYDRPLLLGGAMCGLGLAFAWLLTREKRSNWLGLPMVASFVVLASLSDRIGSGKLLPMMILTGGWAAIYFGVFFRRAIRNDLLSSRSLLLLLGGAGVGLAALGTLWMTPDYFGLLGLLLAVLSAVYLLVAIVARSVWTILAAFLLSLLGMGIGGSMANLEAGEVQTGFLLVSALWTLIYIGSVSFDMFVRGSPWNPARLFVLAGAGVSFVALFLFSTPQSAHLLRALLSLGTGVVYLLVGLRMTKAGDYGANRSMVPLGLALVFFTMAVAFLFTGVTVTVIWAVEAVVLAYLAKSALSRNWMIACLAMFLVTMIRMFSVDFIWIVDQQALFWTSQGTQGLMIPAAFFHPRAIALAAVGAGMLLAAFFCGRFKKKPFFRVGGLVLVVAGHLAVLTLLVTEFRIVFSDPAHLPPSGLPYEEFAEMMTRFDDSLYAQAHNLDMVATVVLGVYAVLLLSIGFIARNLLHRLLGIILFAVTLGKLLFWDIWELPRIGQIVVLVALGLLLLAGGFLYARFGKRLKSLLVDSGKPGLLPLLALMSLLAPGTARALDIEKYEQVRSIQGVEVPGDYRLPVDPALYSSSLTRPPFQDVRITDASGSEIPYLIHPVILHPPAARVDTRVLDPVLLPDGSSRAVLDLGPSPKRHHLVSLTIEGTDFLRPTRVESSPDGKEYGLLAEGAYVFDVSTGGPRAIRNCIVYPVSAARYLRITLLPGSDNQRLPIGAATVQSGESVLTERSEGSIPLSPTPEKSVKTGQSIFSLSELPRGVPVTTLKIETSTDAFVRRIQLEASTRKHAWFPVGGGVVYRVPRPGNLPEEWLQVGVQPGGRPYLRLIVEDGDNPPLRIEKVQARYPREEILFRTSIAGSCTLYIGQKDGTGARYDLAELIRRGETTRISAATMGPVRPNPKTSGHQTEPEKKAWTERHATIIQVIIGLFVLILAVWTIILLRKNKGSTSGESGGGA